MLRIALYMASVATAQAIRVMELSTLNVVSPEAHFTEDELAGGAYYVLETDRSLRLRVMSQRGLNTVSAVFVDEAEYPVT